MGASSSKQIPEEDKQVIDAILSENKVVVFSKTYCEFSMEVKKIFGEIGEKFETVELDKRQDGKSLQSALGIMTSGSTVPRVFICGRFIGGLSETKSLYKSGKLVSLLEGCSSQG